MKTFLKAVGLFALPLVAAIIIMRYFLHRVNKRSNGFFIKEYDEQNIYG
ncbi:MAG: hypothetical protein ACP5US_11500 [Candidatus Kryptoniota bacterium]